MNQQKAATLPWLDLTRYVAALLVVVNHFRADLFLNYNDLPSNQYSALMQLAYCLTSLGHVSVLIFFVLSGYLVGGGIFNKIKINKFNCLSYSIDRFSRIQLPLVSALVLIAIGNCLMHTEAPWGDYVLNFFSLQGVFCKPLAGPLWSLAFEVWFYLLAGAMAAIITLKGTNKKLLAFVVMMVAMLILSRLGVVYSFLWFMGAFASQINIEKHSGIWVLVSGIGMAIFTLLSLHLFTSRLGITAGSMAADVVTLCFGLFACLFIMNVIRITPTSKLSLWLNCIGEKMAKFSYSLYLTHWTVLLLMQYWLKTERHDINMYSVTLFVVGVACSHIVAYLLYLPFESQSYRLKVWLKKKLHVI